MTKTFAGLPVVRWDAPQPADPAAVAWLIEADIHNEPLSVYRASFAKVLERCGPAGPTALILGEWGNSYGNPAPNAMLVEHADRMPNLRALFTGDMSREQCEVSWIVQGDITVLLETFPKLESLWVRSGSALELSPVRHAALTELVVQTGGLWPPVILAIAASDLPRLTRLELWLGVEEYGGGAELDVLELLLSGRVLPALTRLGLRNAENADEIATALAAAPVVARLTELDLSMGTLGDEGGTALLAGQPLSHLQKLNLSYHYLSEEIAARIVAELPGVAVDVSDPQDEDEDGRYTMVSE